MSVDHGPTSPRPQSERSRGFSFHSQNSGSKKDYTESPDEKRRRDSLYKGGSKANPNAALSEAQPGVANLLEQSTLQNLRGFQHLDANGNPIAEPDLSNPTRPRFERPLDTIRSFEKAIDNGYKRRTSFQRGDHDPNNQYASRRSSYFGGEYPRQPQRSRRSVANMLSSGPDAGVQTNRSSMMGGGYYGSQKESYHANQRARGYSGRMASEPAVSGGRPYGQPQHGYHQSYDTVNTGYTNGSDSTGPWANSTDPSSENSSIDRNMAMNNGKPQTPMDGYGHNGPIMEEQGYDQYPQDGYGGPPQTPQHARYPGGGPVQPPPAARRPIPLGGSSNGEAYQGGSIPSNPTMGKEEKRKSWLKRRFSKN